MPFDGKNYGNPKILTTEIKNTTPRVVEDKVAVGTIDSTVNDISGLTAQQIRDRVKEVRVYILSHEGQSDMSFRYRNRTPLPLVNLA